MTTKQRAYLKSLAMTTESHLSDREVQYYSRAYRSDF